MSDPPWSQDGECVRLAVRVTPRAGCDRLIGIMIDAAGRAALAVRLRAPPAEGAANTALLALLVDRLDVPRSALSFLSGASSRNKIIRITGVSIGHVSRRLETGASRRGAQPCSFR